MRVKKGLVVTTMGDTYVQEFQENTLKVLQGCVGGLIEPIDMNFGAGVWSEDFTMWVNEEGKLIGLEPNPFATAVYQVLFRSDDVIMGDVVFTGGNDVNGYTLGLPDDGIEYLRGLAEACFAWVSPEEQEKWAEEASKQPTTKMEEV